MLEKFSSRFEIIGECWVWKTNLNSKGYGRCWYKGSTYQAHRVIFELFYGEISEGLEIDHLCKNRACVNPDHLEAVTHRENIRRGDSGLPKRNMTHCHKGHPLSGDNLYKYKNMRHCRECVRYNKKQFRLRKKTHRLLC